MAATAKKDRYSIVTLPGDGIGPEVTAQAVEAMKVAGRAKGVSFDFEEVPGGGEHYLAHGVEWPEGSEQKCAAADALLLGAVGAEDPATKRSVFTKPGKPYPTAELAGYALVIGNRRRLDLFVNHRPIKLLPGVRHKVSGKFMDIWEPGQVDYVVCRENTEEAYSGKTTDLVAEGRVVGRMTAMEVTRAATERVCRYAYQLARQRKAAGRPGKVTCVTKSNIIGAHKYFEELFREVGKAEFPDIEQDTSLFDAFCMWQIRNPEWFDVVVAPNLVGDVISDNGSTTQGGMGMAAGGNIGDRHGMFEPIHGSAPKYRGQDKVNPMAAVLSAAMLCEWLGGKVGDDRLKAMAGSLEQAVAAVLREGKRLTYDLGGEAKCSEVGAAICEKIAR
jgi:isocitrate/isopropylmalate dehydrogenase